MSDSHRLEDVATYNQESLRTLVRALDLSQGQFSLILVRCNYTRLRDRMLLQLQQRSTVPIHRLALPQSVKTLFAPIAAEIGDSPPPALTVLDLESLENIEPVLTATNLIREEFRKHFPFPLLLWATDEVLRKLIRVAPDFESWATTVEFELPTEELIDFLHEKTEAVFARVLEPDSAQLPHPDFCQIAADDRLHSELESAWKDLQSRAYQLQPDLAATLEFIRGLQAGENGQNEAALEHYRQSLAFWQNSAFLIVNSEFIDNLEYRIQNLLERQGVILFYTGTCCGCQAQRQPGDSRRCWQEALDAFEQSVTAFEAAERQDLVAQVVGKLGEVLRHLEAWEDLQKLAKKYLPAHQAAGSLALVAQDLGFLAEVALQRNQPAEARELAQQAIRTLAEAPEAQPQQRGLYLLLLARSQRQLGDSDAASSLEIARQETDAHSDPRLYIEILQQLRQIYFERGQYLEAFRIKQERRAIEHEYGFRAFMGAGALQPHRKLGQQKVSAAKEIEASGRQRDVSRLIERISRADRKLTVILGPSGVGKSSILTAGLVPALQHTATGTHSVLPVLVQSYTDCMQTFGRELAKALSPSSQQPADPSLSGALQQLAQNGERNLLTVLIFDQFEEFFFICTDAEGRHKFWKFMRDALNIPFVKIMLSVRADYRHYLYYILEWDERTPSPDGSSILHSILSEDAHYYLGNFSPPEAQAVIENLTGLAQFPVEPALVEALVRDLAGSTEEVRPIELQLVGSQLQADGITTLEKYQLLGENPKAKLVKHSIESAVRDCGAENKDDAWKVLALLTNEKGTRPLRTRDELAELLQSDSDKLDLILEILTGSGLAVRLPAEPENRYQLVHDYLVEPIRQTYDFGREVRLQLAEAARRRSSASNPTLRQELRPAPLYLQRAVVGLGAVGVLLALVASLHQNSAQIRAITASSKALYNSHLEFEALIESLKAGKILKTWLGSVVPADIRMEAVTALQQAVNKVRERNRLQGHSNTVGGVSFSPDGQMLASASADGTVKLWNRSGSSIKTLKSHTAEVYSATFSPDGQTLASASADGTVKLWSRAGVLKSTLKGHAGDVFKVSFSPDGEVIASAGRDKTVKLWRRRDGKFLRALKGHTDEVWGVSFSPDGQTLASASADRTVKLWRLDGRLLRTLKGHTGKVFDVSFSPQGEIASAGGDGTIKLWKRDGTLLNTLSGHENTVWSVRFSPDGQTLASASADRTVKLWSKDGRALNTFGSHIFGVRSLSFSPDGKTLASAGGDNSVKLWGLGGTGSLRVLQHQGLVRRASYSRSGTLATASFDSKIRLWNRDGRLLRALTGHTDWVTDVSFSPDGQTLASASQDKTVKLWTPSGQLRSTLAADSQGVYSLAFSPQGEIATAGTDRTVKLWLPDGAALATLAGRSSPAQSLAFSPDGQLIASAGSTEVKLWRFDGTEYKTLQNHIAGVYAIGFSPDGQTFVTASADRTVKLWNRDGRLLRAILGHRDSVYSASFSPDGQIIASGSKDKTVKLWNLDGNLLGTLAAHSDSVWDVRFSPDGKTLASAGEDKKAILWNLDLDDLMARGCDWMRDYLRNPTANLSDEQRHLCDGIGPRK